ncbi:MAG TPA: sulfatase-like hydrolase/transferase [Candidatus Krumholzibacteria bacterium]|nr:sulfatase-like hydrolase/transferase [Candidatus Krumholzibacteria bacterium]HPD72111.1 sulfatase-like hydrolase/transferase [Candidatus Krumholzibacteria bacterium]HRY40957.1 sulfatase-like hydrolase/transferase [Candidatus Krumholzibacteria bacterium]
MARDPFAPLCRRQRARGRARAARRALSRLVLPGRPRARREGPPSVVLIGVDTLRRDHVGPELTPSLHALAAAGLDLTDVTAPAPWTLPSFAGALTGLMPSLHGARLTGQVRNMDAQPPRRLRDGTVTLARHLAARGYATCALYANQFFGFGLAETFQRHQYLNLTADHLLAEAAEWIRRNAGRPFFCFVLVNDPHEPTTPPVDLLVSELAALDVAPPSSRELQQLAAWGDPDRPDAHLGLCGWPLPEPARRTRELKRAVYRACVREIDRAIGRFVERLERRGLADHVLCTVFSDHGEEFCDHGAEAHAWDHDPRRVRGIGHGHSQFQELLHVPWLSWGAGVPALGQVGTPVSLLDLAPTVADWLAAGAFPLPAPAVPGMVGRPLATAGPDPDRVLLAESIAFGPDLVSVRQGPWKLIAHREGRPLGLYDLAADPRERDDRHTAQPERLRAFQAVLARWRQAVPPAVERGKGDGGSGWSSIDDEVRKRLKDLGYGE